MIFRFDFLNYAKFRLVGLCCALVKNYITGDVFWGITQILGYQVAGGGGVESVKNWPITELLRFVEFRWGVGGRFHPKGLERRLAG